MTWSLIAQDSATGEFGIAVATKFFAAGARVPFVSSGVGGIATQALVNPYYGIDGLQLLRKGHTPDDTLSTLLKADAGREHRQVHLIGYNGDIAAHTGAACLNWAGHQRGHCFSVAGNMLAGPQVLERTTEAFLTNAHLPFASRLICAMQAGEAAGGDIRGKQSAALIICRHDEWSSLDIRVDDHPEPLRELDRLEKVSRMEWVRYRPFVPTRANPAGVTDHDLIDAAVGSSMGKI
jgi:uncharacterized Ntn-hydrolase superfamily protein